MRQRPLLTWAAAFAAGIGTSALGWLSPAAALCLAVLGAGALLTRRWPALFPLGLLLPGIVSDHLPGGHLALGQQPKTSLSGRHRRK